MKPVLDTTRLLAALQGDERVHGVVRLAPTDGRTRLIIATTWDGLDAVAARLPEFAALLLDTQDAALVPGEARLDMVARGGERLELRAMRIGELTPRTEGDGGEPLLDPRGLLRQWVDWSAGRPRHAPTDDATERSVERRILACDDVIRSFSALAPGSRLVTPTREARGLRHAMATRLRTRVAALPAGAAADALRARVREALGAMPQAAAGLRVTGTDARERFLAVADDEGFAGDRALLDAAESQVRASTGREPRFEAGFALATFDQVEARYALGAAVGGCKPPLVPGLLVGVAVTPADDLALWAAPTVREPACDAACVADEGRRTVVPRDAGRDALLGACTDAVDEALDALPVLLRRARSAHREVLETPRDLLATLHLPRSFIAAAEAHGGLETRVSRLLCALALARAATDMEPLVARKLEFAAGCLLLGAAPGDDDGDDCAAL